VRFCRTGFIHLDSFFTSLAKRAAPAKPPTLKDCMGTLMAFESQVETPKSMLIHEKLDADPALPSLRYWLAAGPASLNVSGGSKKH
jgi:hypothetical protein